MDDPVLEILVVFRKKVVVGEDLGEKVALVMLAPIVCLPGAL